MAPTSDSSLALAHDYLLTMRGAERTFAEMARCWPQAPIYTLLYDAEAVAEGFAGREVHTSGLQRLGARQRSFRYLLPFFPKAAERLPVQSLRDDRDQLQRLRPRAAAGAGRAARLLLPQPLPLRLVRAGAGARRRRRGRGGR